MTIPRALQKLLEYLADEGKCQPLSTGQLVRLAAQWQLPADEVMAARRYAEDNLLIEPCERPAAPGAGNSYWLTGKGRTVLATLKVPEWQVPPSSFEQ